MNNRHIPSGIAYIPSGIAYIPSGIAYSGQEYRGFLSRMALFMVWTGGPKLTTREQSRPDRITQMATSTSPREAISRRLFTE